MPVLPRRPTAGSLRSRTIPPPPTRRAAFPAGAASWAHSLSFLAAMDLTGLQVGRYRICAELAHGSLLGTFVGVDTGIRAFPANQRFFAIKTLQPALAGDDMIEELLREEARSAARLFHPAFAAFFDLVVVNRALFTIDELVLGVSLERLAWRAHRLGARITPSIAAYIASRVCYAIASFHELRKIPGTCGNRIHGDLCPRSVLIKPDGSVKLLDIGYFHTRSYVENKHGLGSLVTRRYRGPERESGADFDILSDQFAVGAMLFELITGSSPFPGGEYPTRFDLRSARATIGAGIDVDPLLADIVLTALDPSPDRRFLSARKFNEALLDYLDLSGVPPPAKELSQLYRFLFPRQASTTCRSENTHG